MSNPKALVKVITAKIYVKRKATRNKGKMGKCARRGSVRAEGDRFMGLSPTK
jgi:hypothetical protein